MLFLGDNPWLDDRTKNQLKMICHLCKNDLPPGGNVRCNLCHKLVHKWCRDQGRPCCYTGNNDPIGENNDPVGENSDPNVEKNDPIGQTKTKL